MMAGAALADVPQGPDIDLGDDDFFSWSWIGLGENAAVEIDDHRAARPRKGRIVPQLGSLVGGEHIRRVFQGTTAIDRRPPIHRRRRTPRVHIGRDANENFGAVGRELAQRFGKEPIVADRRANTADRRLGYWEQFVLVVGQVVGASVDFPRDPRVDLAVLVPQPFRPEQAGRVEHLARPLGILFEEGRRLDVHAQFAGLVRQAGRVLVGNGNGQFGQQALSGGIDRRGVAKFGKGQQLDVHKRPVAFNGHIDHFDHARGVAGHFRAVSGIGLGDLTGGHPVAQFIPHGFFSSSSTLWAFRAAARLTQRRR